MKFDLTVAHGPCGTDLRTWCMGIAIYFLISFGIAVLIGPSALNFIGFAISVIANVCLLYGCIRYNHMLVAVWLIFALLVAIGFPFAIFGTIFHFGGYRESTGFDNIFMALFVHIVSFILVVFCARLVYSYHLALKNRQSSTQQSDVV